MDIHYFVGFLSGFATYLFWTVIETGVVGLNNLVKFSSTIAFAFGGSVLASYLCKEARGWKKDGD